MRSEFWAADEVVVLKKVRGEEEGEDVEEVVEEFKLGEGEAEEASVLAATSASSLE